MTTIAAQPIGQSEDFMAILDRVSDLAVIGKPILITGEPGTGKELIASRLHFLSPRWEQTFVSVNCAAYTEAELDAVLFGSSLIDGRDDTNGRFFQAHNGTLFLDNIHSVSPRLQEKLMRTIEYGSYEARGEIHSNDVNVRVLAATHIDLPSAVEDEHFRADLLYRLAFDVLALPPLRARLDDIVPLSEHFGKKMAVDLGADHFPGLSAECDEILQNYNWPGNVRELRTVIERSTTRAWLQDETLSEPISILSFNPFDGRYRLSGNHTLPDTQHNLRDEIIDDTDPSTTPPQALSRGTFAQRVMVFERRLIDEALTTNNHHQGMAAKHLGLSYHQFRGLLRKHGLKK
ncbi:MAG: sigma 54-interacting transcriptional regulator [Litorimonas sp.]